VSEPRWFRFYAKTPVWAQNAACSLAGIKMRRRRYNRTFWNALTFLEQSQWWSLAEQQAYRREQLRRIIRHAYETVPYYREVFDERRLVPDDIRDVEDLPKLPILEKQTLRDRFEDLQSRTWPDGRRVTQHTGGTTGKALLLREDKDTQPWHWATHWRHRQRFGVRVHEPYIAFAGRSVVPLSQMHPPIWRRNAVLHQTYVSVHHLTAQNMAPLAEYLQQRRVRFYIGYPSALYLVATYLLENGIRLPHPPAMTFTSSETVLPHQRQVISQAFASDLGDHYSASESCAFISECEKHAYHVDMEYGAVEFLPVEGLPSDTREIIATGFRNPVMPLIRYRIGALATLTDLECPCGPKAPTVRCIDGRIESYIITPDGRRLGRLDFLFKSSYRINEAQLVQDAADHLTVKIVRGDGCCEDDETRLMAELRHYLGEAIRIDIQGVAEIPRDASGKFRQIVSNVYRDKFAPSRSGV